MTPGLDVVTIDGPAGAGKSTVARRLAKELGFRHLDTGSMYRAVTLHCLDSELPLEESPTLRAALQALRVEVLGPGRVALDGRQLDEELREARIDAHVSTVAAIPSVRRAMGALQRAQAEHGPLVAEGRDMGSVVFPDARWKFYLDATPEERARRRARDYEARGETPDLDEILAGIRHRDHLDSSRSESPLVCPDGALRILSDGLSVDEVVARMRSRIRL